MNHSMTVKYKLTLAMSENTNLFDKAKILREIQNGNISELKSLLSKGHTINFSDLIYEKTGDSILNVAARTADAESLKYILENFPNGVNWKNQDNKTPLHEAAQFSRPKNVELLIKYSAEVNAIKRADWTPLMLACTKTNYETVELLLKYGAFINNVNKDGWSPLHLASRAGNAEIVKLLIDCGADVNKVTKNERTALHTACLHANLLVAKELLENTALETKDSCGNSPLHECVLSGNIEMCELLVQYGADTSCKNNSGFGLLHLAASQGNDEMIRYLVKNLECDVNVTSTSGLTPLHCAAHSKHGKTCELLNSLGGIMQLKDNNQRTPLDYLNL